MPEISFISTSLSPLRPQPKHGTPATAAMRHCWVYSGLEAPRSSYGFYMILWYVHDILWSLAPATALQLSLELYCPLQSPRDCCKRRTLRTECTTSKRTTNFRWPSGRSWTFLANKPTVGEKDLQIRKLLEKCWPKTLEDNGLQSECSALHLVACLQRCEFILMTILIYHVI